MPRLPLFLLTLALCSAGTTRAQNALFRFEGAAETQQGARTLVQDSTAGVGLTVASLDSDWQARDVNGYGSTEGRAAYALVGTQQVTLSFSIPVKIIALHAATVVGTDTWHFTGADGETVSATVTSTGTHVALGLTTRLLTITSDSSTFFPLLDDIEIVEAQTSTDVTGEHLPDTAPAIALYPLPLSTRGQIRLSGLGQEARVTMYDALGRTVAVLYDGPSPSTLTLTVEAQRLAAGTYLVVVESGGTRQTHPFVVAR